MTKEKSFITLTPGQLETKRKSNSQVCPERAVGIYRRHRAWWVVFDFDSWLSIVGLKVYISSKLFRQPYK